MRRIFVSLTTQWFAISTQIITMMLDIVLVPEEKNGFLHMFWFAV